MNELRHATIELPAACGDRERQRLLQRLARLPGVEATGDGPAGLAVEYRFPEQSFAGLWQQLDTRWRRDLTAITRLRCGLRALLEENERDQCLQGGGWQSRIEAIYARHFDRQPTAGVGRHTPRWQEYSSRDWTALDQEELTHE